MVVLCDDPDHACIEYLDINETNNCVIATTTKDATKEKFNELFTL